MADITCDLLQRESTNNKLYIYNSAHSFVDPKEAKYRVSYLRGVVAFEKHTKCFAAQVVCFVSKIQDKDNPNTTVNL